MSIFYQKSRTTVLLYFFILIVQNTYCQANASVNLKSFVEIQEQYQSRNYDEAIKNLRTNAEAGFSDALILLAMSYDWGIGVERDSHQAALLLEKVTDASKIDVIIEWIKNNAQKGDKVFQMMLGNLYMGGFGLPQDYEQGVSWITKSAEQGYKVAQLNLVRIYGNGIGVQKDKGKSQYWFKEANKKELLDKQKEAYGGAMLRNVLIIAGILLIYILYKFFTRKK